MIDWLSNILNALVSFFNRIGDIISSVTSAITKLFDYVQQAVEFVHNAFFMIPTYYLVYGGIILVVLIVFLIVGRNAGGD